MTSQRGKRKVDQRLAYAAWEALENRQMLTTIFGGQQFEFIQYDGSTVRVTVEGPSTAQLDIIGATENNDGFGGQFATLNQIPGVFTRGGGANPDRFGGLGGADGVEPINTVTGAPNSLTPVDINPNPNINQIIPAPSATIHYDAMSSNSTGKTWVVSLQDAGDANEVWLTSVNYTSSGQGSVVANIAGQIVAATPGATDTQDIEQIVAADFMPGSDNLLYFIAVVNVPRPDGDGDFTDTDVPFLYCFDLNADTANGLVQQAVAIRSDPFNNVADVTPDVFGMTINDDGDMILSVTGREVQGSGDDAGVAERTGLVVVGVPSPTDPTPLPVQFNLNEIVQVQLQGELIEDLRGLEAVPGDTNFVYGISGDAASSTLLHVNYTNGVAANFGGLPDPDDTAGAVRGEDLTDLVWNPRLLNQFNLIDDNPNNDSRRGALIAQDSTTDELVIVDTAQRFAETSLYHVRLTNGTPDTRVSISVVSDAAPRPETPFNGDIGQIRHIDAQGGDDVLHSPAGGTGEVLVGLRTIDVVDATTDEEDIPVRRIKKTPSQRFGAFPQNSKFVYAGISASGDVGNFLVAGTVMGRVTWEGNIAGALYAGEFLTGDPAGRAEGADFSDVAGNIFVSGDARNIIARSSIGSTFTTGALGATYLTGADVVVGGKLGQLKVGDAFYGNVRVGGAAGGLNKSISEIEDRRTPPTGRNTYFEGYGGVGPSLGDVTDWYNDSFDTAQIVGTHYARAYRNDEVAVINGTLNNAANVNDAIDTYAMGLMAGQTVHMRLDAQASLNVALFDSDGRLVASDRSDVGPGVVAGKEFTYKVDRPGQYFFRVAFSTDTVFDGNPSLIVAGPSNYTLRITNVAKVSLGGVIGAGINGYQSGIANPNVDPEEASPIYHVQVDHGDIGVITAGQIIDSTFGWSVARGNVRGIIAGTEIGTFSSDGILGNGVMLWVPRGSVGLVRTGTTAELNDDTESAAPLFIDPATLVPDPTYAIGGDYQWIDCGGEFRGNISAARAVGNFHAGSVLGGKFWIVNADRLGNDGYWALADITGDLGVGSTGGPNIYTGPGGNFGYMVVGGTLFAPSIFGGGQRQETVYEPGEIARLTDDSGIDVKVSPAPRVNAGTATNPNALADPGQLSVLTFPVAETEKNGVIIVRINLDDENINLVNHGLQIESAGALVPGGSVEIGEINTFQNGRTIQISGTPAVDQDDNDLNDTEDDGLTIRLPDRNPSEGVIAPTINSPVDLIFKGASPINVWEIEARDRIGAALTTLDSIQNSTSGEIVNVIASAIGDLTAEHIGIPQSRIGENKQRTGLKLMKNTKIDLVTLFGLGQTPVDTADTGITLSAGGGNLAGYLISARSRQDIGNIYVNGIISSVVANSNGKNVKGVFEGITAPIIAGASAIPFTGRIRSVQIGEGLAPTGTGAVPHSGIFAASTLGTVSNQGLGSDIRGDIMVGYNALPTAADEVMIRSIELTDGSIINADIALTSNVLQFNDSEAIGTIEVNDTVNNPRIDIEQIVIEGRGGIIGSTIRGADIGEIVIEGGFGILNSSIVSFGDNKIQTIETDGYGIRDTAIGSGATVDNIIVNGTGKDIDANWYSSSVRQSGGKEGIEPFSGQSLNELNDLHRYLGTTNKTGKIKGVTKSGIIEDSQINSTRNLSKIDAYQIVGRQRTTRVQFGNQIDKINVRHAVDNMIMSTGKLNSFVTGSDISYSNIGVAGTLKQLSVGGTFRGTSKLTVTGPQGVLTNMTTKNGLFGVVNVTSNIGTVHVGGELGSRQLKGLANMTQLIVDGNVQGSTLVDIRGKLSVIGVGKDVKEGAVIRANSNDTQTVKGDLEGDIVIG